MLEDWLELRWVWFGNMVQLIEVLIELTMRDFAFMEWIYLFFFKFYYVALDGFDVLYSISNIYLYVLKLFKSCLIKEDLKVLCFIWRDRFNLALHS